MDKKGHVQTIVIVKGTRPTNEITVKKEVKSSVFSVLSFRNSNDLGLSILLWDSFNLI